MFMPKVLAELQIPLNDSVLTALAAPNFPVELMLAEETYTLSAPRIENRPNEPTEIVVDLHSGPITIGILTLSSRLDYQPTVLILREPSVTKIDAAPHMQHTAQQALQRFRAWLRRQPLPLLLPIPEQPLLENDWLSLTSIHAGNGALILVFH